MEDNESCGSRPNDASSLYSPALSPSPSLQSQTRQQRQKLEVYNEVLRRLKDSNNDEALQPGFDDQLWSHFNRLPTRYHTFALNFHIHTHTHTHTHTYIYIRFRKCMYKYNSVYYTDRCFGFVSLAILYVYTHTHKHIHIVLIFVWIIRGLIWLY